MVFEKNLLIVYYIIAIVVCITTSCIDNCSALTYNQPSDWFLSVTIFLQRLFSMELTYLPGLDKQEQQDNCCYGT